MLNKLVIMKKIKEILLVALLGFAFTIYLSAKTYAYSFKIENDYAELKVKHDGKTKRFLSISTEKPLQISNTYVVYSSTSNPSKPKVIFDILELVHQKKQGIHEVKIKVNQKEHLKVIYFCDIKFSPEKAENITGVDKEEKNKKSKKFIKKLKYNVKKWHRRFKKAVQPNEVTDIYVKIVHAQLDGVEMDLQKKH